MSKKAPRLFRALPVLLTGGVFLLLAVYAPENAKAAGDAIVLCGKVIVPSLLPFFIVSGLLSALGLPRLLAKPAAPVMKKLFSLSGAGAAVFVMGLTGGYPIGAAAAADMVRNGDLKKDAGEKLLRFCNNSGPAFILGAAGGIFGSFKAGLLLYLSHALAAVLTGSLVCRRGKTVSCASAPVNVKSPSFFEAFPAAVEQGVKSTLIIGGYVIFFSVLRAMLESVGLFSAMMGALLRLTPLSPGQARALLTGLMEIGGGIGAMAGQRCTAGNLALCAFLLGWGGLSVQFQTRAVIAGSGLDGKGIMACKLLHGVLSALLAGIFALLI